MPWQWLTPWWRPRAYAVHRKSGPANASIGPNFTRILTLTVPAGCYAVFGKTEIQTNTQASADCKLGTNPAFPCPAGTQSGGPAILDHSPEKSVAIQCVARDRRPDRAPQAAM
jgi:hypothetical protein